MRTKLLILILLNLALVWTASALEQSANNVFAVNGLKAFADSDTLDNAQREAMNAVEQEAFVLLLKRLLPTSQSWKIDGIKKDQAFDLVESTNALQERKTSHSYMATVDVIFDKDKVRNLLNSLGITYADRYSEPMLVVPFIVEGNNKYIWSKDDWAEAWGGAPSVMGLQRYAYMLGDLEDINFFERKDLSQYEYKDFTLLLKKYEATDILIIEATKNKGTFLVKLRMITQNDDITQETKHTIIDEADPYTGLIDDTLDKVDEYFKGVDLFDVKKTFRTRLSAQLTNLEEWSLINKKLSNISEVKKINVIKSSTNLVVVDMIFETDPLEMSEILAKSGFEITEDGDIQYLKLLKN